MVPNPEQVRWVFFDFAGTLAFNDPARPWNYVRTCARHGFFFDRREVRPHIDEVWGQMDTEEGISHPHHSSDAERYDDLRAHLERQILVKLGIPDTPEREEMVRELMDVQDAADTYTVYPEVPPALARLQADGFKLCIVSNFNWTLPEIAEGIGIARYMDAVVTSARVGFRKPHSRIYEAALEITGAQPAESLFVGDSHGPDYEGPVAAGFQALMIDRRVTRKHKAPTIHRMTELPELLTAGRPTPQP